MTSRDAAAALMCKLGCFTEDEQSSARAKVPTERAMTKNFSISESDSRLSHPSTTFEQQLKTLFAVPDGGVFIVKFCVTA